MSGVKCQPNRGMVPFSQSLSRVFDEFWPGFTREFQSPVFNIRPSVDIIEEQDKVVLKADMPGLEKNDVRVVVHDGLLTIEGKRQEQNEENDSKRGFARVERFMGTFSRSFNLPAWADGSQVQADYKNGVLTVTIPKTEKARPKEIEIKID